MPTSNPKPQLPGAGIATGFLNGIEGAVKGAGNALSSLNAFGSPSSQTTSAPIVKSSSTGGTVFPVKHAAGAQNSVAPTTQQNVSSQPQGLASLLTNTYQTPNGGTLSIDNSGNVTGYNPAVGYSINTSGTVPSSAFSNGSTSGDVMNQQQSLQDYVNGVAQANGYSPAYLQALQGTYGAQTQGAQLGLNSSALQSNLYTGNNLPGDTMNYAQGATAKAQAQNTLQQSENQIQQLSANQALNTQQLARTGNIAGAQAQLQYSPTAVSEQNAQAQYQALQQQYAGVNIPAFDPNQDPQQQLQSARMAIATSPAYQAGFQSTYQTPGGGTGIYSKLNLNGLQQNQDGSYTLVPATAAALGAANATNVNTNLGQMSQINAAIQSSSKTLDSTTQFMQQNGLNQTGVPLIEQIKNSTMTQTGKQGAIVGLNADLNALRSDYAQYLTGRSGSIAGTNDEANAAIPDTISPIQLTQLIGQMQTDGQNAADSLGAQVNQALQGISTNSNQSNSGTSQTVAPGSFASGTGWN